MAAPNNLSMSEVGTGTSPSSPLSQMASRSYSQQNLQMLQQSRQPVHLSSTGNTRNMQQLDANLILARMVTANGGAGNLPIRMASFQDAHRSLTDTLPHQQNQRTLGPTSNQAFDYLSNGRTSNQHNTGSAMGGGPAVNPLLKLMEERMSAGTSQRNETLKTPIQVGPVSTPVRLESPMATQEQQAALQRSINKWAGIDHRVNSQSNQLLSASRSHNALTASKSFHKQPTMESVNEDKALKLSFRSSQPLSSQQQELLNELLLEQQRQENGQGQINQADVSAQCSRQNENEGTAPSSALLCNMMPAPTTNENGLTRCAVSQAELDRLRQENNAIQLLQHQAKINEQFYLHQRSMASSLLASSNQSTNSLHGSSNESLKQLKRVDSYRKRNSERLDDDDTACTSASHTASHTSNTPSIQSNASFSSKARRTSLSKFSASMENLRLCNGNLMNTKNDSFSNGLNNVPSHNNLAFNKAASSNQNFSVRLSSNRSLHLGLDSGYEQGSSPSNLKKKSSRSLIHSLIPSQNKLDQQLNQQQKNNSLEHSRPPSVGIDHNLCGQTRCQEKIIMSDIPDRIRYKNAGEEATPKEIVMEALKSRGISSNGMKSAFDMPDDFFVKSCDNYHQEAVDAIRSNDIDALRKLKSGGTNLQCANKFGESLIHLACRRSNFDVVSFLINEAGVSLRVRDDYGRTPFHDACWRGELDLDLINMLLEHEPKLLMLNDKRGHSPLDYTRREHWVKLIPFLIERANKFQPAD